MEGADPHAARAAGKQGAQALAHLCRGLVGEGDGQDLPGTNALVGDHVGDAHGQHAGLAGAGARQDQQRAMGALDGLALGGVEAVQVERGPCRSGSRDIGRLGRGGRDVVRGNLQGGLLLVGSVVGIGVHRHLVSGDWGRSRGHGLCGRDGNGIKE